MRAAIANPRVMRAAQIFSGDRVTMALRLPREDEAIQTTGRKINELMTAWSEQNARPFVSFEYYAPRTEAGVQHLLQRLDRMAKQSAPPATMKNTVIASADPLFMDVTWGAGGSTSELTTDLCLHIQKVNCEPNMHLTWCASFLARKCS